LRRTGRISGRSSTKRPCGSLHGVTPTAAIQATAKIQLHHLTLHVGRGRPRRPGVPRRTTARLGIGRRGLRWRRRLLMRSRSRARRLFQNRDPCLRLRDRGAEACVLTLHLVVASEQPRFRPKQHREELSKDGFRFSPTLSSRPFSRLVQSGSASTNDLRWNSARRSARRNPNAPQLAIDS
jgi:hypothetical protein